MNMKSSINIAQNFINVFKMLHDQPKQANKTSFISDELTSFPIWMLNLEIFTT